MFGLVVCVMVKLLRGLACLAAVLYSLHVSAGHQTLQFVSLLCAGNERCNCRKVLLSPGSELCRRSSMLRICAKTFRGMYSPIINSLLKV